MLVETFVPEAAVEARGRWHSALACPGRWSARPPKKRQRIDPNQELIALGSAMMAAILVTLGFGV